MNLFFFCKKNDRRFSLNVQNPIADKKKMRRGQKHCGGFLQKLLGHILQQKLHALHHFLRDGVFCVLHGLSFGFIFLQSNNLRAHRSVSLRFRFLWNLPITVNLKCKAQEKKLELPSAQQKASQQSPLVFFSRLPLFCFFLAKPSWDVLSRKLNHSVRAHLKTEKNRKKIKLTQHTFFLSLSSNKRTSCLALCEASCLNGCACVMESESTYFSFMVFFFSV